MTARRPFRSGDDARAADAAAPFLASLRADLLVAPDDETVAAHLEMIRLEQQLFAFEPRRPRPRRSAPRRRAVSRPRRSVCVVAAVCLAFATCGLDAVGALPAPLQHISNSIKHHLGIDGPTPDQPRAAQRADGVSHHRRHPITVTRTGAGSANSPVGRTGSPRRAARSGTVTAAANPTLPIASISPPGTSPVAPVQRPPTVAHRPPTIRKPPKKSMHSGGGPPPGLPVDWQHRAVEVAAAQLDACAAELSLAPTGCPQVVVGIDPSTDVDALHWTLLQQVRDGAVVTVEPVAIGSAPTNGAGTTVTVYGHFRMYASYTVGGDPSPRLAYSGGIARATMVWDGSSFPTATYTSGSVDQLPVGVTVAPFARPAAATDAAVRSVVTAGFAACAAGAPTGPNATTAGCPQIISLPSDATNARWTVVGDPGQDALVSYDSVLGEFVLTADFVMTVHYETPAADTGSEGSITGQYKASVFFDGVQLRLISIEAA